LSLCVHWLSVEREQTTIGYKIGVKFEHALGIEKNEMNYKE